MTDLRLGSPDRTDTLYGTETLRFSDKDMSVGVSVSQNVENLYESLLYESASSSHVSVAAVQMSPQLLSGALSQSLAIQQIILSAENTSSVATLSNEFFTGTTPTSMGMTYLILPGGQNSTN